jgi:hypothetical protein
LDYFASTKPGRQQFVAGPNGSSRRWHGDGAMTRTAPFQRGRCYKSCFLTWRYHAAPIPSCTF